MLDMLFGEGSCDILRQSLKENMINVCKYSRGSNFATITVTMWRVMKLTRHFI